MAQVLLQQGLDINLSKNPDTLQSDYPALVVGENLINVTSQTTIIQSELDDTIYSLTLDTSGAPLLAFAAGNTTQSSGVTLNGGANPGVAISADNNNSGIIIAADQTNITSYGTVQLSQKGSSASASLSITGGNPVVGGAVTGNAINLTASTVNNGAVNFTGNVTYLTSAGSTGPNGKDTVDFTRVNVTINNLPASNVTEYIVALTELPTTTNPSPSSLVKQLSINGTATILIDGQRNNQTDPAATAFASSVFMVVKRPNRAAVIFQAPSIKGSSGELWGLEWGINNNLNIFLNPSTTAMTQGGTYTAKVTVIHNPTIIAW